jgi:hypothetical protein
LQGASASAGALFVFDVKLALIIRRRSMSQKSAKSVAELESMIMAELREHPECESVGVVVIRPTGLAWDAVLVREGAQLNDPCETKLAEIVGRLRQEFDLSE